MTLAKILVTTGNFTVQAVILLFRISTVEPVRNVTRVKRRPAFVGIG
jgi:hypothetical protein